MIVRELIALLQTMPQDALVIRTMCSDYDDVEPDQITLMEPKDSEGIIRHYGHLMYLKKDWWPYPPARRPTGERTVRERPKDPVLLTCVHFAGN